MVAFANSHNSMKKYRFILLVQQNYSFEILRPMHSVMQERGDQVLWLKLGKEVNTALFNSNESVTQSIEQAIAFNPDAIFVTGNTVPDFIPGLKVQLFHGFEWKKKGHFRIRGSFDLYCTQGPLFTRKFEDFAEHHGYFDVVETGWPKMDNAFPLQAKQIKNDKNQILYLPTFSPRLTSTIDLLPQIEALAHSNEYRWIIKFHPKMAKKVVSQYELMAEQFDNVTVYKKADLLNLIRDCDLVLSDTSSAIAESLLHRKPVITYRNSMPDEYIVNFTNATELHSKIKNIFENAEQQGSNFDHFAAEYHPLSDGKASNRVIDAAIQRIDHGLCAKKKKPANFIRNIKLRRQENFWPWTRRS
jgi:CDP-glycerol glycerophosphotransferase (TagB/SpsB family)